MLTVPRAARWRGRILDSVLAAAGAVFGAASLRYPLGHDQGVHFYVAREWMQRGAVPYLDTFDHKTPGIYVVHALAMAVFGARTWAIRPFELLTVLGTGWLAGAIARPAAERVDGWRGAGALVSAFVYYGFFTWLATAQPDFFAAALATGALAAARRIGGRRGAALSGLLAGAALVLKPPIAAFVLVAAAAAAWPRRGARSSAERLAAFALAVPIVPVACVVWLARHHALASAFEILVVANRSYAWSSPAIHDFGSFVDEHGELFGWFHPVSTILVVAAVVRVAAARRLRRLRARDPWPFALVVLAAGYASVLVQMKFHTYHYAALLPGITLVALAALDDLLVLAPPRLPRAHVAAGAAALVALAYPLAGRRARAWSLVTREAALVAVGVHPPSSFDAAFRSGPANDQVEARAVAGWLLAHSTPDDAVAVRGFAPEIYALSNRRYPGRFFWTSGYTDFLKEYPGVRAWREQDRLVFDAAHPRFVVVSTAAAAPESRADLERAGYVARATFGTSTVFVRARREHRPIAMGH